MKKIILSITTVIVIFTACTTKKILTPDFEPLVPIWNGSCTHRVSFNGTLNSLTDCDVIFVGEIHNDSLTHVIELELLKAIHQRQSRVAVSLEMFERDVQSILDDYLRGKVSENEFLKQSRPWKNYMSAYRPLIEYCKKHGISVIAMNIPRRYARRLSMMGEKILESIPDSERVWIARNFMPLNDQYKERFMKQMREQMPDAMSRIDPENLYKAQVIKDDTMAESINDFIINHPGTKVVSFQGDFHSAYHLGIVKKLKILNPLLKIKVVSIVPVDDPFNIDKTSFAGRGDFLIFVERIVQE